AFGGSLVSGLAGLTAGAGGSSSSGLPFFGLTGVTFGYGSGTGRRRGWLPEGGGVTSGLGDAWGGDVVLIAGGPLSLSARGGSRSAGTIWGNPAGSYSRNSSAALARLSASLSVFRALTNSGTRSLGSGRSFLRPKRMPAWLGGANNGTSSRASSQR